MKKALTFITLGLIGVLALMVIVFTFVSVNYKVELQNPDSIRVYKGSYDVTEQSYQKGSEEYEKILELYNSGFSTTVMNTVFNGSTFYKTSINDKRNTLSSVVSSNSNDYFISFNYNSPQQIKHHGVDFQADESAARNNTTFTNVLIQVKNSNGFAQITIYYQYPENASTFSQFNHTTLASQSNLYNYLETL